MHSFKAIIEKFLKKGEKSGWTIIEIPDDILLKLKRKDKKEFRIKGVIDDVKFERMATFPIGEGRYIIALNADLRKKIQKKEGATVSLKIALDKSGAPQAQELLDALNDDVIAKKQFDSLTPSHQNYFHQYVITAKGIDTKAGRIVNSINAMYKKQNFGEMIRSLKKEK